MTLSLPVAAPAKPPRVVHLPEVASWDAAEEGLAVAEEAGLTLDDWQEFALAQSLGLGADGRWSAFETALVVPRQSGKSEVFEARCLVGLYSPRYGGDLTMFTAHEYKTAREIFLRLVNRLRPPEGADIDGPGYAAPWMREMVKTIRTANGEESIELRNGRRLRFLARTGGSGRGFTGDTVIFDEAHAVRGDHVSALLPTLSSRPNPQVLYGAAGPMGHSEHQLALRTRALEAADDDDLVYLEWSAPDDADMDDENVWAAANPAHPHRITSKYLRRERAAMDDESFARERLCLHNVQARHSVIAADTWARLLGETKIASGHAFAVDTDPARTVTSIVVAGWTADEKIHLEVVEHRAGTDWAPERLAELVARRRDAPVVLDPAGAAGSLVGRLAADHQIEPLLVTGREMAAACGYFYDLATADDPNLVHHKGAYHAGLSQAVDAARRRTVGDAWAWHRRDASADITPLVAATLAVWALKKPRPKKGRGRSRIVA